MADHFAPQIVFIVGMLAFMGVVFFEFGMSMQSVEIEKMSLLDDPDFDDTWIDMGAEFETLENQIPDVAYYTIVVTIIVLGLYITFKTVSGALPNWLSGG